MKLSILCLIALICFFAATAFAQDEAAVRALYTDEAPVAENLYAALIVDTDNDITYYMVDGQQVEVHPETILNIIENSASVAEVEAAINAIRGPEHSEQSAWAKFTAHWVMYSLLAIAGVAVCAAVIVGVVFAVKAIKARKNAKDSADPAQESLLAPQQEYTPVV